MVIVYENNYDKNVTFWVIVTIILHFFSNCDNNFTHPQWMFIIIFMLFLIIIIIISLQVVLAALCGIIVPIIYIEYSN